MNKQLRPLVALVIVGVVAALLAAQTPGTAQSAASPTTAALQSAPRRVHVLVSGRVQGVGFRFFVQTNAQKLKLTGWVKNLADGRVESVIEGPAGDVDKLLDQIHQGPPTSKVDKVEVTEETPTGEFKQFEQTG